MMRITCLLVCLTFSIACRTNEAPEQQVGDLQITAQVKTKLAEGLGASSVTNISVNTTDGVVTLAGTVHTPSEESKAVAIARAVLKVSRVNDDLPVNTIRTSSVHIPSDR